MKERNKGTKEGDNKTSKRKMISASFSLLVTFLVAIFLFISFSISSSCSTLFVSPSVKTLFFIFSGERISRRMSETRREEESVCSRISAICVVNEKEVSSDRQ